MYWRRPSVCAGRWAERFHCLELYLTALTPVMGVHAGPGVLGVIFYPEG